MSARGSRLRTGFAWLLSLFVSLLAPAAVQAGAPPKATHRLQHGNNKGSVAIRLTDGHRTVIRTRNELGLKLASKPGTPLAFTVAPPVLKAALRRVAPRFRQPGRNAKPYLYRGRLRIDPGSAARALNIPATAERIARGVRKNPASTRFRVVLSKKPPVLSAPRLKGITGVLGSYTTAATSNLKRGKNIRLAVHSIDGTVLSPGETFSLNQAVGPRTQARGYRTAPVFMDAEKVPGIGGGVSQVTGTLFNAAALAGLRIVEVNPHSRPVAYIPVGRDATVALGSKDLKFKNDTGAPVYIAYHFDGRRLRATLYGRKRSGQQVALRPRVQRLGSGKIDAQLYRVVRQHGKLVAKEKLFDHAYRWDPKAGGHKG